MDKKDETRITLRLPSRLANDLSDRAKKEKRSLNGEIVYILDAYLERKDEKKK